MRKGGWCSGLVFGALLVAAMPACSKTASVIDVYTALDGEGNRRRNVFFTDTQEIHCIAEVGISRKDATFQVQTRMVQYYDFVTRQFVDTDRVGTPVEDAPGPQKSKVVIDSPLTKIGPDGKPLTDSPYPAGRYICEVYLDGELGGSAVFNVLVPPCPDGQLFPGTKCYEFFDKDAVCPAFGISSTDPAKCRCDIDKGWDCQ
jgi:hypothetical protein